MALYLNIPRSVAERSITCFDSYTDAATYNSFYIEHIARFQRLVKTYIAVMSISPLMKCT